MSAVGKPHQDDAEKRRRREAKPPPAETGKARPGEPPAAGPHAAPDLSNPEATPGAGALQTPGAQDDMDSTG